MSSIDSGLTRASLDWIWSAQGWTIFEILRYMSEHNWSVYEEALKANPVLAKMMVSGGFYSLGDWIAQVPIQSNSPSLTDPLSAAAIANSVRSCLCCS
mgnify:CR=1 FL=1